MVVRPDILWSRRAGPALDDAERIHAAALAEGPGLTERRAEELIAEIRAGRDAR